MNFKNDLNKETKKLYNSSNWKNLRNRKLDINPICEVCDDFNFLEIDHIIDHSGNEKVFFDIENLRTLCKPHHSKKSLAIIRIKKFETTPYGAYFDCKNGFTNRNFIDFYKTDNKGNLLVDFVLKNGIKRLSQSDNLEVKLSYNIAFLKLKDLIDLFIKICFSIKGLPIEINIPNKIEYELFDYFLKNIYGEKKYVLKKF